jgi:CheY-like chemotaxis protein
MSTAGGSNGKKKILIVEDEPDVLAYLEMLLRDAGYVTVSARDGLEGMKLARREKPDLVTLDIVMPETTGARFYKEIRSDPELAKIPVVIVTAVRGYAGDPYGYEKFISKRHSVPPPDGFFPKPIDKDAFLEAVRKLVQR